MRTTILSLLLCTVLSALADTQVFPTVDNVFTVKNTLVPSRPVASGAVAPSGRLYPAWDNAIATASNAPAPAQYLSDEIYSDGYEAYRAFNINNNKDYWSSSVTNGNKHWIGYDCGAGNSNVVGIVQVLPYNNINMNSCLLEGSLDGASWSTLRSNDLAATGWSAITNNTATYCRYFRLRALSGYSASQIALYEVNFSSASFSSPIHTATNAAAAGDSYYSSTYPAWKAFDVDNSTGWQSPDAAAPHWISYDFATNSLINGFHIVQYANYGANLVSFQGQTDGATNWVTLITTNLPNIGVTAMTNVVSANTTAYRSYRLDITSQYGSRVFIPELAFKYYRQGAT